MHYMTVRQATRVLPAIILAGALAGCGTDPLPTGPESSELGPAMAPIGVEPFEPREQPRTSGQVSMRVADGYSIQAVHAQYGTTTLDHIPGTSFYLIATPEGVPDGDLITALYYSVLCDVSEPNYLLEPPEAEQRSVAFYEGTFDHQDYVGQDALGLIGAEAAHVLSTGAGIRVAVIDTGADLDHVDLIDRYGPGYDFIDNDAVPDDLPNNVDDDADGLIDEATGHGTHVAGIIAAVAPEVTILPYRVLDSDGIGSSFNVAGAIRRAADDGADVINLSLGMDTRPEVVRRAIDEAEAQGILVVASAGNRGIEDRYHFPASENGKVMAVTATDQFDIKAAFASYGSHVDLSAPGVGIMSTYWNGGYAVWSGTSMAAPFVAGAAALGLALAPVGNDIQATIEDTSLNLDAQAHAWRGKIGKGRLRLYDLVCTLAPGCDGSAVVGSTEVSD